MFFWVGLNLTPNERSESEDEVKNRPNVWHHSRQMQHTKVPVTMSVALKYLNSFLEFKDPKLGNLLKIGRKTRDDDDDSN